MRSDLVRLTRPATLAASVVPVAVGTAAGALARPVSPLWTAVMLVVALLLQIATNMANEYFDYRRGLDDESSVGIAGVIVSGRLPAAAVARLAALTYALAFVLGVVLAIHRGLLLILLGLASIGAGVVYSAGPRPISSTPLGEAFVFLLMGPLEVAVSEVAAAGVVTAPALVASVTVGALVAAILLANNLRDLEGDRRHGRRTLPVVVGRTGGRAILRGLVAVAYAWPTLAALAGLLPVGVLLTLVGLPAARRALRALDGPNPVPAVARAHLVAGLFLAIGLALPIPRP
jgi:1,4-dihydroxy-2-naphthoate octaprenyltransferase